MEKIITGFENYSINQIGQVKNIKTNRILKYGLMTSGYYFVNLKKDKKGYNKSIHRLIAQFFISNCDETKNEVNHKNGIKTDNRIENLEWVTRSENIKHMYDIGLKNYKPKHYKGKFGFEHNRSKSIICLNNNKVYGSISEASRELNVSISSISLSLKENRPTKNMHFQWNKF